MKLNLRKIIIYLLIGVGFGGLIYIGCLWLTGAKQQTVGQITQVVLFSGLIGVVSMIFEWERPAFTLRLLVHFALVYVLVALMLGETERVDAFTNWYLLIDFSLIYLMVWGVVYYAFYRRISNINRRLIEKRESNS